MAPSKQSNLEIPEIFTSEEKYHFLFEHLYDAAFLVHVGTGIIQETNLQGEALIGKSRNEIVGQHYLSLHPKNDASVYRRRFARCVKLGRLADFDGEIITKEGAIIPVNLTACNFILNGQRLILGLFHDITQRKKAEEALKQSTTIYRDLFRTADVGILVSDLKGRIKTANRTAKSISGYSMKELMNMDISELLFIENRRITDEMERLLILQEAVRRRLELEVLRKDRIRVPVESVVQLIIQDGKPTGFHIMFRDITRQKRLNENMQSYIAQIIKAQEDERKRIARDLHDETVQSLATLALRIQAITTADVKLPEEIRQSLDNLRAKTSAIQDQVRRFSHELRPDVLDYLGLVPALQALTRELQNERKEARLEIIGNERRLSGEAELALFRIAQEALNNVKKHAEATQAIVRVRFTPKKVKLTIVDNGKGFKLPEMASDFVRKGKLGLIGIHERARLLNGTLSISSHEGEGTTLNIEVTAY